MLRHQAPAVRFVYLINKGPEPLKTNGKHIKADEQRLPSRLSKALKERLQGCLQLFIRKAAVARGVRRGEELIDLLAKGLLLLHLPQDLDFDHIQMAFLSEPCFRFRKLSGRPIF